MIAVFLVVLLTTWNAFLHPAHLHAHGQIHRR